MAAASGSEARLKGDRPLTAPLYRGSGEAANRRWAWFMRIPWFLLVAIGASLG
jgi:hypothetical protein